MAYDVRMFKLVTGELVIGKYDESKDCITDAGSLQTVPTQQAMQMLILPYGYPFEPQFSGTLDGKFFMYRYEKTPQELQDKYLEACTNLTLHGGMGSLHFGTNPPGLDGSGSGLIK